MIHRHLDARDVFDPGLSLANKFMLIGSSIFRWPWLVMSRIALGYCLVDHFGGAQGRWRGPPAHGPTGSVGAMSNKCAHDGIGHHMLDSTNGHYNHPPWYWTGILCRIDQNMIRGFPHEIARQPHQLGNNRGQVLLLPDALGILQITFPSQF
jgi:hypothetical protein